MRTLVFTLLVGFVVGACSVVFDEQGSSSNGPPDAVTADGGQQDHDGGHSSDAGCDPDPADGGFDPYDDAAVPADADLTDASIADAAEAPDAAW